MNNTVLLYQFDQLPIFQNRMYDSKEEAINCPKGTMRLVENLETGLIYNDAFLPELMVYDGNYQNEQGVSPLFQLHLETVATAIGRSMGKANLVEVGCGKGYFLEMLLAKDFDITGFDPTYEGVNPRVKRTYFAPNVIEKANGLILRHVLEHIQNPVAFLEQLKAANGGSGEIYIEVPCFDWIAEHRAWFDIFYEHVNYFRLADFKRMFGEVIESGKTFGGQYLYVIAELSSLRIPIIDRNNRINFPSDFTKNITEQNRTEQNSNLGWCFQRRYICFAQGAYWPTCQHCYRYQSSKAGQISPLHWPASSIARTRSCWPAKRLDHLCHEFKLSRRNKTNVSSQLSLHRNRS